jgi:uncharacterized LabA/DUF88 family protein
MPKASVYIDGGPFLDGVRGQGMSMDMDFIAALRELLADVALGEVHYFVSQLPEAPYPAKYKNQFVLFDRLRAQGIEVHLSRTQVIGSVYVDRGTEAAMACQMITDAYAGKFDRALLVSKRQDLAPIISAVQTFGKAVDVAFFRYQLDPVNPLHAVCDGKIEIEPALIVRHRINGPTPILHAG